MPYNVVGFRVCGNGWRAVLVDYNNPSPEILPVVGWVHLDAPMAEDEPWSYVQAAVVDDLTMGSWSPVDTLAHFWYLLPPGDRAPSNEDHVAERQRRRVVQGEDR